jgi:tripeptidyl-peptidase-2
MGFARWHSLGPLRLPAMRVFAAVLVALGAGAPSPGWAADPAGFAGYLSTREVGAQRWLSKRPRADGRGVVIAVLDTGVDPTRPGLDKLPDGRVKLIEARDFTEQGDVALTRAVLEGGVLRAGGVELSGLERHEAPLGRTGHWVGTFSEESLRGGSVEDIDGDGRNDTRFGMVAYQRADGEAVVIVDTDGDGDLAGEVPRRSYADEPKPMFFGRSPKRRIAVLPTVLWHERKVSLHFDDGAHGTHCAGIAAGFGIEGRQGFDGVAPGAEVMSLKIGHGRLSGGATVAGSMVAAIRFASAWAKERSRPVVLSMSYGVGSETEGRSEIDEALGKELAANPWLVASLSAGNEGPGLSSVGTPAASTLAIAVAAMVTPAMAETLLGAKGLVGPQVFGFSSRGGELDKPDVLAPGIAWSTVPAFNEGGVMSGTSMAAPQVSGVLALVWSAALEDKRVVTGGLLRRALRHGARPIAGYSSLDQGAGLVDVDATYEAVKKAKAPLEVAGFAVETAAPAEAGARGPASYWRVGARLMGLGAAIGRELERRVPLTFTVTPLVYGTVADEAIPGIFQRVELKSDVDWLEVDRRELGLKGDTASEVVVLADLGRLAKTPGVHLGRVRASQGGVWAFELPVVVVVPHTFRDTWVRTFEGKLQPGEVARVLVEVPPGATAMITTAEAKGDGAVWLVPFDPSGRHVEVYEHRASEMEHVTARFARAGEGLLPGTWELTVIAPLKNPSRVEFELEVAFTAIDGPAQLPVETGSAGVASGRLTLVNRMDQPFQGTLEARVIGQARERALSMETPRQVVEVEVGPGIDNVELEVVLDPATWARMTDFAFLIRSGETVIEQSALSQRVGRLTVPVKAGARLDVELVAGLVDKGGDPVKVTLRELHRYAAPTVWGVELPRAMTRPTLHVGVPTTFVLSSQGLPALGGAFAHVTELTLTSRDGALWQRWRLPHQR